ncbi:MAG: hypothetical protein APF80_03260 [Alphaproteobacteria bacterium BRH_c36]|nr:MAG: hypothetical protein APF80_03260 [Alphaproteobacteria bacterium BRH_c36]
MHLENAPLQLRRHPRVDSRIFSRGTGCMASTSRDVANIWTCADPGWLNGRETTSHPPGGR